MVELLTQREKAYHEIKNGILNFKWRPGEKLVERQLSEELGVSRTPIRESLNRLEIEGLVKHISQWGVYVKKLNEEDVIEMYEVREALEGVGARLAALRAREEDLDSLKQTLEKMEQALMNDKIDTKMFNEADNEFHSILVKTSHNKKLIDLASMCHMHVEDLPRTIDKEYLEEKFKKYLEEHKNILSSLEIRDSTLAEELIRAHISDAKKDAELYFDEISM